MVHNILLNIERSKYTTTGLGIMEYYTWVDLYPSNIYINPSKSTQVRSHPIQESGYTNHKNIFHL